MKSRIRSVEGESDCAHMQTYESHTTQVSVRAEIRNWRHDPSQVTTKGLCMLTTILIVWYEKFFFVIVRMEKLLKFLEIHIKTLRPTPHPKKVKFGQIYRFCDL